MVNRNFRKFKSKFLATYIWQHWTDAAIRTPGGRNARRGLRHLAFGRRKFWSARPPIAVSLVSAAVCGIHFYKKKYETRFYRLVVVVVEHCGFATNAVLFLSTLVLRDRKWRRRQHRKGDQG